MRWSALSQSVIWIQAMYVRVQCIFALIVFFKGMTIIISIHNLIVISMYEIGDHIVSETQFSHLHFVLFL